LNNQMFFALNSENDYLKHSHTLIGLNLNASNLFRHLTI
jgi:hypothetical protein